MALEHQISHPGDIPTNDFSASLPEDALSRESLLELFDQDAQLLAELAELFLADSRGLLSGLAAGVAAGDAVKVEHAAHALKGSVGNFGAKRAAELARRIETMGRNHDLGGAAPVLRELSEEISRVNILLTAVAGQAPA